jgi:thiol-disulfide isomerase/thioredoxin
LRTIAFGAVLMTAAALTGGYVIDNMVYAADRLPAAMQAKAPELAAGQWLNVTGGIEPPGAWRGQVTVVHFWTYGCINCKRNLPVYNRWRQRFAGRPVAMVGIHTPEFEYEAQPANVARRVKDFGIAYPVLLDPDQINWRRWNQQFWPAVYLVDKRGWIRYRWDGELNYGSLDGERKMTERIEELLQETL